MKKTFSLDRSENCVCLASRVVYGQKQHWCNAVTRQLTMSFMCPRRYFHYDTDETQPVIVFICGGGFEKQDTHVWVPELAYFAKHGYSVACVDYSVEPFTVWPEQIEEIKLAIRYLRAHAKEFHIDPDRIAVMGESAGGYLAALCGVTSGTGMYDKPVTDSYRRSFLCGPVGPDEFTQGEYLDYSSDVQCVVPWYGLFDRTKMKETGMYDTATGGYKKRVPTARTNDMPDLTPMVTKDTPPFCMVHGTGDHQVDFSQSELMYDALQAAGVDAELLIVEGAEHADAAIVQTAVKEEIVRFLDSHLK